MFLLTAAAVFWTVFIASACGEFAQTEPETFYSETRPRKQKEFRWTNGKMPKTFDPALASAPPETDIVRAVFEGLTDTNPKSLEAIPAVASKWNSADGTRVWTFELRKDVYWSNGERVTAIDFVRSWKRLLDMGTEVPHHSLLHNFVGVHDAASKNSKVTTSGGPPNAPVVVGQKTAEAGASPKPNLGKESVQFGVEAVNEFSLRVKLSEPDEEFPKLVAHPMFRPVYGDGKSFENEPLKADIVTNGAFKITSVGTDGVTLDRRERFFDRGKIKLKRVKFVPSANADAALAAYKAGDVDVVTNADFEPLALKLLKPYVDFRQTTHSALNFYEFNQKRPPFNDRRVREALAISIDRQRITEGEMEGAAKPAYEFLPFDAVRDRKIASDVKLAKELFDMAGYPNAAGFPKVRLLVNRNNVQEKVARSVVKMWKEVLNVDTELILKDNKEMDAIVSSGEYDLIRRGVVLPTADETANMLSIFSSDKIPEADATPSAKVPGDESQNSNSLLSVSSQREKSASQRPGSKDNMGELLIDTGEKNDTILTEAEAIASIPAIPLYFPTSYSLVKPYVFGFEMNTLDAPTLKNVYIDSYWQPRKKKGQS